MRPRGRSRASPGVEVGIPDSGTLRRIPKILRIIIYAPRTKIPRGAQQNKAEEEDEDDDEDEKREEREMAC